MGERRDWRSERIRYLVHFSDGGAGMRFYNASLHVGQRITDHLVEYVVAEVRQPRGREGLGHAWAEPLDGDGRLRERLPE